MVRVKITIQPSSKKAANSRSPVLPPPDVILSKHWFCYLLIQLGGMCKNEAKIIVASEIFINAYQHNSGDINDKGTKAAKGSWMPEMVIGPFVQRENADLFRDLWIKESRGIIPRRERGIELVKSGIIKNEHIKCYDKRLVPLHLNEWLVDNDLECLAIPEERLNQLLQDIKLECRHDRPTRLCTVY